PKVERRSGPAAAAAAHAHAAASSPAPSEEPEPDTVVSPGIIEPWGGETALSAQEPGWIAEIAVKEGETVQAGQLLATLEDAAQRRSVDLASADLAEAAAALDRIEHGATAEEARQARADRAAAAARSALASSAAARSARLHERGAIPDSEADRATAESQALAAEAERAEARLQELLRGGRAEDRSAARARVDGAKARLELARANLSRRRILAPRAGTVLLSRFHAGEFYNVGGAPLLVLGDMSRLQVRLEVDEIDALAFEPGAPCALYSDAGVRLTQGAIVRLAPKMGRRALSIESPTARSDVRVREAFVEIPATSKLIPGQRVWGHASRATTARGPGGGPPREG
ncbi:MAG TPA: HlyD family efflux transporter periplasmic adaptor subunit, partial [Anaeromyxobacter sp.]